MKSSLTLILTMLTLTNIHPSWQKTVSKALACVAPDFLEEIEQDPSILPKPTNWFNAFSLPLDQTRTILFGESPYPRKESANGYAFWDAAVTDLWSSQGLSTRVNRATSLRNFIKMLLIADGILSKNNISQTAIAQINKSTLIATGSELFHKLMDKGILLLNASLTVRPLSDKNKDAKAWLPFINSLLESLAEEHSNIPLLLFGKIANIINTLPAATPFKRIIAEHPYNLSFIKNTDVLEFFSGKKWLFKDQRSSCEF